MARGELLIKLFRSHRRGDASAFRSAAMEVVAEEERKNNHKLARDLRLLIENGVDSPPSPMLGHSLPRAKEDAQLATTMEPTRGLSDLVVRRDVDASVERIIKEWRHAEVIKVHGLRPATRLLFAGPSGTGKTLCAEAIASELGLPLLVARFDAVISSYLGETAANLRRVFEHAARGRWVVLFDEFDAIGKSRDDENEHGELKRVVNTFLQLLDAFSAPSLVIAATNHAELLDTALWRRFDEIIEFKRPTVPEIRALIGMKLANFPTKGIDLRSAASSLRGLSHADVERICIDAVKTAIVDGRESVDQELFDSVKERHMGRRKMDMPRRKG